VDREFKPSELTSTIVYALKRAISTVKPFAVLDHCASQKNELQLYKELLERIEREHLDVSLRSRLE
jgi:hypothetical protein